MSARYHEDQARSRYDLSSGSEQEGPRNRCFRRSHGSGELPARYRRSAGKYRHRCLRGWSSIGRWRGERAERSRMSLGLPKVRTQECLRTLDLLSIGDESAQTERLFNCYETNSRLRGLECHEEKYAVPFSIFPRLGSPCHSIAERATLEICPS